MYILENVVGLGCGSMGLGVLTGRDVCVCACVQGVGVCMGELDPCSRRG